MPKRNWILMKNRLLLVFNLLFVAAGIPCTVAAMDHEEIFYWVADTLQIDRFEENPSIFELGDEQLKERFLQYTERDLKLYRESLMRMGWNRNESKKYIDNLIDDVAGFFSKKDGIIYIKNSLDPCYKESIVAHEITHFFQFKYNTLREELRELQAGQVEKKYYEEHCDGQ
jgi:hypothetical protein